ncbi:MAG TPA: class I SAM-dependent methyltransferase [Anaerolineaceae bacterium]|jgi:SAM-dependent methyltransferase|nr:class I SAM-dependent methyltransferase [Anaerolineaceae bacterium]
MALGWKDFSTTSFNALLLLERVQISWLPAGNVPVDALAAALHGNPAVLWFLQHKCPEISPWLDELLAKHPGPETPAALRVAEVQVLQALEDWLIYVLEPECYDRQPFTRWDSAELLGMADFTGKTVIDVGAGTGRLALTIAPLARLVYAVEPVTNLRDYLRTRAAELGLKHVHAVDGLITALPFPDGFADITMGGHVFGDELAAEWQELTRVTCPGGSILLCPGNSNRDNAVHRFLVAQGCQWAAFDEPTDGMKRKYWCRLPDRIER